MFRIERKYTLKWKLNRDVFEILNAKAFDVTEHRLGTSKKPCNILKSRSDELRAILPTVVGKAPQDEGWQDAVNTHIDSLSIIVPAQGWDMDCSYVVDYNDSTHKSNLQYLLKQNGFDIENKADVEIDAKLEELFKAGKVEETDLYRYVTFENPERYLEYRYCLLSRKVANNVADVEKSIHIDYFIASASEIKVIENEKAVKRNNFIKVYSDIITNPDTTVLNDMLIVGGYIGSTSDITGMDHVAKTTMLYNWGQENPEAVCDLAKDKHLKTKARVQKYIWANIFRRLGDTETIVDAYDSAKVIGRSLEDCVAFWAVEENKPYLSECFAKYREMYEK